MTILKIEQYEQEVEEGIADVGTIEQFVNGAAAFLTSRLGRRYPNLAKIAQTSVFPIKGDFGEVVTIETRSQLMRATDGTTWRYNGVLPFVTDATTSSADADWEQVEINIDAKRAIEILTAADRAPSNVFNTWQDAALSELQEYDAPYEIRFESGRGVWDYVTVPTRPVDNTATCAGSAFKLAGDVSGGQLERRIDDDNVWGEWFVNSGSLTASDGWQKAADLALLLEARLNGRKNSTFTFESITNFERIEHIDILSNFYMMDDVYINDTGLALGVSNGFRQYGMIRYAEGGSNFWGYREDKPVLVLSGLKNSIFLNPNISHIKLKGDVTDADNASNGYLNFYGGVLATVTVENGGAAWSNAVRGWGTRLNTFIKTDEDRMSDHIWDSASFEGSTVKIDLDYCDSISFPNSRFENTKESHGVTFGKNTSNCNVDWIFNSTAETDIQVAFDVPLPINDLGVGNSALPTGAKNFDTKVMGSFNGKTASVVSNDSGGGCIIGSYGMGVNVSAEGQRPGLPDSHDSIIPKRESVIFGKSTTFWTSPLLRVDGTIRLRMSAVTKAKTVRLRVFCYDAYGDLITEEPNAPPISAYFLQWLDDVGYVTPDVGAAEGDKFFVDIPATMLYSPDVYEVRFCLYAQEITELYSLSAMIMFPYNKGENIQECEIKSSFENVTSNTVNGIPTMGFAKIGDTVVDRISGKTYNCTETTKLKVVGITGLNLSVSNWSNTSVGDVVGIMMDNKEIFWTTITGFGANPVLQIAAAPTSAVSQDNFVYTVRWNSET